jgi:hypothetical protein
MAVLADTARQPIHVSPALENSAWYGSALVTFLVTAEMTDGRYSLPVMTVTKGFAPPSPYRHGAATEDEE